MTDDLIIGGVILSALVPELLLAALLTGLLTFILLRLGVYRLVRPRALVELAIFCMIMGAIVAVTPDGWPIWPDLTLSGTGR